MAIANTVTALIKINRLQIHSPLNMVRPIKLHKSPAPPSLSPKPTWSPCLTVMWTRPYEPSPAKPRGSATAPLVGSTVLFTMSPPQQVTAFSSLYFVYIKLCVCVYEIKNSGIGIFCVFIRFQKLDAKQWFMVICQAFGILLFTGLTVTLLSFTFWLLIYICKYDHHDNVNCLDIVNSMGLFQLVRQISAFGIVALIGILLMQIMEMFEVLANSRILASGIEVEFYQVVHCCKVQTLENAKTLSVNFIRKFTN